MKREVRKVRRVRRVRRVLLAVRVPCECGVRVLVRGAGGKCSALRGGLVLGVGCRDRAACYAIGAPRPSSIRGRGRVNADGTQDEIGMGVDVDAVHIDDAGLFDEVQEARRNSQKIRRPRGNHYLGSDQIAGRVI